MKKLYTQLFQPFILISFFWIAISIMEPSRSGSGYRLWHFFGFFVITMSILLGTIIVISDKKDKKD